MIQNTKFERVRNLYYQMENKGYSGERISVIVGSIFLFIIFSWLYQINTGYRSQAAQFPRLVLAVGLICTGLIILYEVVLFRYLEGLLGGSEESARMRYLKGEGSQFPTSTRFIRGFWSIFWTGLLMVLLSHINVYLAISIVYIGFMLTLGAKNYKLILLSLLILNVAVYGIFQILMNIPFEVFSL